MAVTGGQQRSVVDAARAVMNGPRAAEMLRLDRIRAALSTTAPTVILPKQAPETMLQLAAKARTNVLPLIVRVFVQSLTLDGCMSSLRRGDNVAGWEAWQRNKLDARQAGLHQSTLEYGAAYMTVLPSDTGYPVMRGVSPRQMTALYGDADDDWPLSALHVDGPYVRLYDEEQVHFLGVEPGARSGLTGVTLPQSVYAGRLDYIDSRPHGMTSGGVPVVPVVRYRDSMLLAGEEQFGIVEPLISIQERIDETVFGGLVAQYFTAFALRYIIGWVPTSEADMLKASASSAWTFADPEVKVGQLPSGDPAVYTESKQAAMRDMAALAQVPAQSIGGGDMINVSAEALASLQFGKDRRTDGMATSLGESHEQGLQLAAEYMARELTGEIADRAAQDAGDFATQTRWRDTTARSLAQTVDALGKLAATLGVPQQALWERVPGVTDGDLERWKAAAAADPLATFTAMLDQQAAPADLTPQQAAQHAVAGAATVQQAAGA